MDTYLGTNVSDIGLNSDGSAEGAKDGCSRLEPLPQHLAVGDILFDQLL